jgi:hypothetical protein
MKNRIITISREFGSGGRTIGKKVADKLGSPCYDAEFTCPVQKNNCIVILTNAQPVICGICRKASACPFGI